MRWRRGDAAFGSLRGAAAVAASIFAVLALVGCPTASLDQRRHHLVTVGLGAASLDDNQQPVIQPDRLELHRSLVVHGAYDYRLMGPGGWLAVSARVVSHVNRGMRAAPWRGASVSGEQVTRPCDLFWAIAGPSIGLQVPANLPLSLVGDVGYALAYLSRKRYSDSGGPWRPRSSRSLDLACWLEWAQKPRGSSAGAMFGCRSMSSAWGPSPGRPAWAEFSLVVAF